MHHLRHRLRVHRARMHHSVGAHLNIGLGPRHGPLRGLVLGNVAQGDPHRHGMVAMNQWHRRMVAACPKGVHRCALTHGLGIRRHHVAHMGMQLGGGDVSDTDFFAFRSSFEDALCLG